MVVGIVSSMILARLLTPADVGIFSVTMVLLAMVTTVRDLGAGQYLVQEKHLTADSIRAVWTVQLGLGALLGCAVMLASTPLATFYNEPRMRDIMLLLAFSYFINPLGSVTYAWLMREMRYDAIAIMRFSSTIGGAATSIVLAQRGYGPISLAWGALCSTVVNAGVSVLFRPSGYPWLPGLREVRRVVSFGTKLTSVSIINTVSAGAPEYLLGKLQSLSAAGFYSRSNGLVATFNRLVTDAVSPVAFSLLSKAARESREFADLFLRAISYITVLSWTFSLSLIFLAHPAIRVLYGTQWDQSVDLARLLAAALIFTAPLPLCFVALISAGSVTTMLKTTAATASITVALCVIGARLGLLHIGFMLLADAIIGAIIWLSVTRTVVKFGWRALWPALRKSGNVAIASALCPLISFVLFGAYPEHYALPLAIGAIGSAVGFLVGVKLYRHPIEAEIKLLLPRMWPSPECDGRPRK